MTGARGRGPGVGVVVLAAAMAAHGAELKVRASWGHSAKSAAPFYVRLAPAEGVEIRDAGGWRWSLARECRMAPGEAAPARAT